MGKELKFIHITKTAGTSIEDIAKENGVDWGRNDIEFILSNLKEEFSRPYGGNLFFGGKYEFSPWHTPIVYYKDNAFDNYDTFTVVRNPYSRCISEMYCTWTQMSQFNNERIETKEQFNEKLRGLVLNIHMDHFYPQSPYTHKGGKQIIDHILKFENLEEEFNNLMVEYGYDMRLDRHVNPAKPDWVNLIGEKYTISDLEPKTINVINHAYHDDFINFNYNKIDDML